MTMRILVLSNFYPPYFVGGYELGCEDVVKGLKARGHDVRVLTSAFGLGKSERSGDIYRWLETDLALKIDRSSVDIFKLLKKESTNQRAFIRVCNEFSPEVLYVWNPTHISISIALRAQQDGLPACYFISDHWLTRWESDALYSLNLRSPRRRLRRIAWKSLVATLKASGLLPRASLDLTRVQFASRFLKRAALEANRPVSSSKVIHWGIDVNRFQCKEASSNPKRLLYVGQLTSLKGVHTAVEALKVIVEQGGRRSTTLTIVGGPDYDNRIHRLVCSLGLENNVRFTGLIPRQQLPSIYREHDILLFPSIWDEPFSLTLLEALSSGLAVVGTDTGGSSEILSAGQNALIFEKEDAEACAKQVMRLLDDPGLVEDLRLNGRAKVEKDFRLDDMVNKIDIDLKRCLLNSSKAEIRGESRYLQPAG